MGLSAQGLQAGVRAFLGSPSPGEAGASLLASFGLSKGQDGGGSENLIPNLVLT